METVDIASESESETDSDIEEITSDQEKKSSRKPAQKKDPGKLASIFMPFKKKIVEDPEKVAARRAFLLSSAPEECRSQLLSGVRDSYLRRGMGRRRAYEERKPFTFYEFFSL